MELRRYRCGRCNLAAAPTLERPCHLPGMLGCSLFLMTTDNSRQPALSADDVLVYVGNQAANFDAGDNYEEEAGIRRRAREQGLEVVTVDDSELDRLRNQVQRIVSRLEAPDGKPQDEKRQDGK